MESFALIIWQCFYICILSLKTCSFISENYSFIQKSHFGGQTSKCQHNFSPLSYLGPGFWHSHPANSHQGAHIIFLPFPDTFLRFTRFQTCSHSCCFQTFIELLLVKCTVTNLRLTESFLITFNMFACPCGDL